MGVGNREDRVGNPSQLPLAFRDQRNDRRVPGFHFHQIAHGLFIQPVPRRQHNHWHVLIDERDRAVLHLSRGVAFCMDIRHFFQLQCTFERDGVIDATTEEQKVPLLVIPFGNCNNLCLATKHLFNQYGKPDKAIEPGLAVRNRQDSAHPSQMQRQHVERRKLGSERFGRSDADFRPTMRIEHAV